MSAKQQLIQGLRGKGLRLTPQREMILSIISKGEGHFRADVLLAKVRKRYPYLNKSVVYRTLDLFTKIGILNQTDFGKGYLEYELHNHPHHHHLFCQRCGGTTEIDESILTPGYQKIEEKYGFQPSFQHLAIMGFCRNCRRSAPARMNAAELGDRS